MIPRKRGKKLNNRRIAEKIYIIRSVVPIPASSVRVISYYIARLYSLPSLSYFYLKLLGNGDRIRQELENVIIIKPRYIHGQTHIH